MKRNDLYIRSNLNLDLIYTIWLNVINIKNEPERDVAEWQNPKK